MERDTGRAGIGTLVLVTGALAVGTYFAFAAVQGEYGVFRRVQITAETRELEAQRDALAAEVARMTNLTARLSDEFLDLDLLDERARDVLGYLRADEIVAR